MNAGLPVWPGEDLCVFAYLLVAMQYFMYSIPLVLYFYKGPLLTLMQDSSKRQRSNCL